MGNPGRASADQRHHLKRYYGLTEEAYQAILQDQRGRCAVCQFIPQTGEYRLCVDHSHKSKEIRGLLCHWCNVALGRLKDDPKIVKALLKYLTRKAQYGKVKYTRKRWKKRQNRKPVLTIKEGKAA